MKTILIIFSKNFQDKNVFTTKNVYSTTLNSMWVKFYQGFCKLQLYRHLYDFIKLHIYEYKLKKGIFWYFYNEGNEYVCTYFYIEITHI